MNQASATSGNLLAINMSRMCSIRSVQGINSIVTKTRMKGFFFFFFHEIYGNLFIFVIFISWCVFQAAGSYGNEVTLLARPMPIEYLLVHV